MFYTLMLCVPAGLTTTKLNVAYAPFPDDAFSGATNSSDPHPFSIHGWNMRIMRLFFLWPEKGISDQLALVQIVRALSLHSQWVSSR